MYLDGLFKRFLRSSGIWKVPAEGYCPSYIALDGGNVVDNNKDKLIISERIYAENPDWKEEDLKAELESLFNAKVAFIPDRKNDTTGHSDGMVSFIEENVLLVADYYEKEFYDKVKEAVLAEFPDLKIVRMPFGYPWEKLNAHNWRGFRSAVGVNVNTVVTNNALYVPVFGNSTLDKRALDIMKEHTNKEVHSIDTSKLSKMGGSVRCMTWQIESDQPAAKALLEMAKKGLDDYYY